MNFWLIFFMVCAIALIVGPIMMFRPSPREAQLAQQRQLAAEKGLRVRLSKGHQQAHKDIAIYSLPFEIKDVIGPQWLLVKQSFQHDLHFKEGWDWSGDAVALEEEHDWLKQWLDKLDDSIIGVEFTGSAVGLWWAERSLRVDDIEILLLELRARFTK